MTKNMSKGTWVRRMSRDEFRGMDEGETVRVIITSGAELESLRAQASKMGFNMRCHFCVNYQRGEEYATVTRMKEKPEYSNQQ